MPDVSKERIGIIFQNSSPKKSEERINIPHWLFMPLKMTPLSCLETSGTSSSDVAVILRKNEDSFNVTGICTSTSGTSSNSKKMMMMMMMMMIIIIIIIMIMRKQK